MLRTVVSMGGAEDACQATSGPGSLAATSKLQWGFAGCLWDGPANHSEQFICI